MVSILAWALVSLMVVVPLGLGLLALRREHRPPSPPPPDRLTYATLVKLHAIRQRLNVSQYRSEVRRDGAKARRALQSELRQWEDWEGQ